MTNRPILMILFTALFIVSSPVSAFDLAEEKPAEEKSDKKDDKPKTTKTGDKIYTWIDANGDRVYSSTPRKGAKEMTIKESTSYSEPEPVSGWQDAKIKVVDESAVDVYDRLGILSPANDATVRDNNGNFQVAAEISPSLKADHWLRLTINGSPVGNLSRSPIFSLTNIDRGSHILRIDVVSGDGKVIKSSKPSTVHLHRARMQRSN